eukprot:UN34397
MFELWNSDQFLVMFSFILILFYTCFHTKSGFLGLVGSFQILLAIPPAGVIYRYIFYIDFWGTMNPIVIFIMIGIGADDMFVMNDAWGQSRHIVGDDPYKRMGYTFRRGAKAMLITSLTTSIAFFATSASPLVPIRAFGIFAGTVIAVNYIYFIVFFPCLIIIQERYPKLDCCQCCTCCPTCCGCESMIKPIADRENKE